MAVMVLGGTGAKMSVSTNVYGWGVARLVAKPFILDLTRITNPDINCIGK